jgi:hypothetical protein
MDFVFSFKAIFLEGFAAKCLLSGMSFRSTPPDIAPMPVGRRGGLVDVKEPALRR